MEMHSIMCVRDRATAVEWYEVFFGRPADMIIDEEYLWQAGENAWIVVDDRDVRAGRVGMAMITFGVTGPDLDAILARFAAHGIEHDPAATHGDGERYVVVRDPDGNSLSLAEMSG